MREFLFFDYQASQGRVVVPHEKLHMQSIAFNRMGKVLFLFNKFVL